MAARISLDISESEINGPFPTADAVSAVGAETLIAMASTGGVFWADHGKQYYYAFQEVQPHHKLNVPWVYTPPKTLDECSVQYGRVKIWNYEKRCIIIDTFSKEVYMSPTLVDAFEIAVAIVHYFPDDRYLPEAVNGRVVVLPKLSPTKADYQPVIGLEQRGVWSDNGKATISLERTISITLSDAISILFGDRPSQKFLADIATTFPQALVACYGPPMICYDKQTTLLSVAQSISSLAHTLHIPVSDAIESFARNATVGKYSIVGGWGYRMLRDVVPDQAKIAAIDLALAHATSPEITKATVAMMFTEPS